MLYSIFYIILGYLLGSIPFGYLITHFSTGKNILEIGWRKTSGSNVFKSVGKWQGFLTGIGDVGKGFLAVWLAQKFGLPIQTQALCGVAAVTGHNWSIFLKFAGGERDWNFYWRPFGFVSRNFRVFFDSFDFISPHLECFHWHHFLFTLRHHPDGLFWRS